MSRPINLLFLLILLSSNNLFAQDTLEYITIYVWGFNDNSAKEDPITQILVTDFEKALVNQDVFKVLDRIRLARLLSQYENEKTVQSVSDISNPEIDILSLEKADLVCFGELLIDDTKFKDVRLTISVQNFNAEFLAIESVTIKRKKLKNHDYRERRINLLAKKVRGQLFSDLNRSIFSKTGKFFRKNLGRGY